MTTSTMSVKERTEWLDSFSEGCQAVRFALSAMENHAVTLRESGLDGVADKLMAPLALALEGVAAMDSAVSQMIHEQAQESWNQIGETFKALLSTCAGDGQAANAGPEAKNGF